MTDFRRHDDDPLYERLTRLETQVAMLETKVNSLSLEQKHMLELFGARFSTLERAQDLTISELRSMNSNLVTMTSEADKSPAGRALLKAITEMSVGELERADKFEAFKEWQQRIEGVLGLLKWAGLPGLIALLWVALQTFGKP